MSEELIIDLSNYKDRVGSRVDPGTYRVQVEDVESTKSGAGNPMVNLWLRITGGDFDGQAIVDRLTITEKSLFRVVGFMQAIGYPTPKKSVRLPVRSLIGKVLDIQVEDGEPYNGRVKSEVRGYIRVAGVRNQSEDDFDAMALEDPTEKETSKSEVDLPEPEEAPKAAAVAVDADDDEVDLDSIEL